MLTLVSNAPGAVELLLGNEAFARGALEAGVKVAAAYPGTPSSEILESLARVAKEAGVYVEWSVNEKVASEVAAAASLCGLRALTAMKHEGINVAMDFLAHLNLVGVIGGMVVVVGDDPEGWSSPGENDSRLLIRWLNVPLLEPATAQEAKDMTRWAFDLSEEVGLFCVVRSCTRVSHATGTVVLGEMPAREIKPHLDTSRAYVPTPVVQKHETLLSKLEKVRERFEASPYNSYEGPERPELVVVASGSGRLYAIEAVEALGLRESVGILHLGTTWPLPTRFIEEHLARATRVLVLEEVDPFLEISLKEVAAERGWLTGGRAILGKETGYIQRCGELTPDAVIRALAYLLNVEYQPRDTVYFARAQDMTRSLVIERETIWCPGCPHRASLWSIKNALRIDGRDGFVTGDIGCYALDRRGGGGFQITKTASAMGSGTGIASGLGKLTQFGFDQPVVAVCGDSTFYHAAIPALINAKYNRSNFTLVVLDNSATAMTGFQPHPGVGRDATGEEAPVVDIAQLCQALGIEVEVLDPFDIEKATGKVLESIQRDGEGVRVFVFRRECALLRPRDARPPFRVRVEQGRCLGEECGCGRYCVRLFRCPGLVWDRERAKARIDEAVCVGCGVCSAICPASAIVKEPTSV